MRRRDFANAALLVPFAGASRAQTTVAWPQRPVRFVLSQPAGAGPDILARLIADRLSRMWRQPIVVDNRPGRQNVIGALAAARAPADGYTFYYATTAALVTNAFTFKSLPYDPVKDFVPVRLVGRSAFLIAAASGFEGKDLTEVIAMTRAKPGSITIATEGPKTFSGMLVDSIAAKAGVKFTHVPYNKAPEAIQDVIGKRVHLVCLPDAALSVFIKGGQLRALAVSTAQRQPEAPHVPALSETFAGFEYTGWNGLFAPTGTPTDVVARVNRDLDSVLRHPEVVERLQQLGSLAEPKMSVTEFETFMRAEHDRWRGIVQTLGITAE